MAGMRRGDRGRFSAIIWPGFVDAMAGLLMIVMFVLTVFVVVQSIMRDRITSQDQRLDQLGAQVAELTGALGLAREDGEDLRQQLATETDARAREAEEAAARLAAQQAATEAAAQEAARLIAAQRTEIDESTEAARLAAARREALEALITDLHRRNAEAAGQAQTLATRLEGAQAESADLGVRLSASEAARGTLTDQLTAAQAQGADLTAQRDALSRDLAAATTQGETLAADLDAEAAARLVEAAAAEALRARLADSEATLSARDLALEAARKEAEDTLTLLAAAEAARDEAQAATQSTERTAQDEAARQAALLSLAQRKLSEQEALTVEGQRQVAALNAQVSDLRDRLGQLQSVLDASTEQGAQADLRIEDLGAQLNEALLRAATLDSARAQAEAERAEAEAARAAAEAEARALAEAEAQDLARYRSEFFGQLSTILQGREGVEVVGDRFVFSSEVLFSPGEAVLSPEGREQVRAVTEMLDTVAAQIPAGIDWVIRVDGHTDNQPLSGAGRYRDNWELSQARALAVVRFMVDDLGFAPDRLVAAGFGENRPAVQGDSPEARAANRRIELKLTER